MRYRQRACAPRLAEIVKQLGKWAESTPGGVPESLAELTRLSQETIAYLDETGE
jgi:hypothetical protein